VYGLLEPGPVVLLATAVRGRPNVMPLSWHMMVEFEPPLVACVVSDRNHSFAALKATRECTINVPTEDLAAKVVRCGNASGRTVDKFQAFGLTPVPAASVRPPLVDECYASLECRVVDARMVPRYGIFVLEVLRAWVAPGRKHPRTIHHRGHGHFFAAGRTFHLASAKA
jgi:flavin reductase (DIM6/NTAB) family NADH-FMN oxidoreductase RutF